MTDVNHTDNWRGEAAVASSCRHQDVGCHGETEQKDNAISRDPFDMLMAIGTHDFRKVTRCSASWFRP